MNCDAACQRLLEADLAKLRGEDDGELARHLESCERCRKQARAILDQYALLRGTLERQTPRLDPADPRWQRRVAPAPARRWVAAIPLALAAGLAILLVARRHQTALEPSNPEPLATWATPGLDVQGPPGRSVAVFQTDNPNIVVIWSF
jgi:predicted anti-sigma-YlaC factor YlaD